MKNIHFCTVILALISVVAGQTNVPCGSTNCAAGEECCSDRVDGQVCFNPTNFACVLDEKLCPIDQNVCFDTVCFDRNVHVCLSNGLNQFLCPKGTIGCGSNNVCLDPHNYVCVNGLVSPRPAILECGAGSCASPQQCCNGNCFDPTTQVCAIAEGVAGLVCPINSMGKANGVCNLATGAVCYDMDIQRCLVLSTGHQLCNIGEADCASNLAVRQEIPPSMLRTSAVTSVEISAATSAQTSEQISAATSAQTSAATSAATTAAASVQTSAIAIATSAQVSQATSIGNSVATSAVMPSVSVAASVFSSVITSLANAATAIVTSVVSTTTAIIEATASTTTTTVAATSAPATVVTTQTVAVETSSTAVLVTAQGSGAPPPAVAVVSLFFGLLMLIA